MDKGDLTERIQVVLVEPSFSGNVGSVARALDNLGFRHLALVQPCEHLNKEARAMACNALWLLEEAKVYDSLAEAVAESSLIIGVTARHRSFLSEPALPSQLPQILSSAGSASCSILFGNERIGLKNQHLSYCNSLLTFPTNPSNPSLNLAQAVLLTLWELKKTVESSTDFFSNPSDTAISKETQGFKAQLSSLLDRVGYFKSDEQKTSLVLSLADLIGRMRPNRRDLALLRGMLHRMQLVLNRPDLIQEKQDPDDRGNKKTGPL